jgi:signal transduction histidine kinase
VKIRQLSCCVERLTKADRLSTAAAAVAHDLNNELTVILTSVTNTIEALEPGHPSRDLLLDLQGAAQRCAWKTSGLLNYSVRQGARTVAAPFEELIDLTDSTDGPAAAGPVRAI